VQLELIRAHDPGVVGDLERLLLRPGAGR